MQPEMRLSRHDVTGFQQRAADRADRLEHALRHLAVDERQRSLQ